MDSIPEYVDCKNGRKAVDVPHPALEPVLRDTYGVIVYQEQVMQAAQLLAGYSFGEADLLRRAMGKKKPEEMIPQRARFMAGAAERGVPAATAQLIFDRMEKFAGYGFNKGHAAPYALIAYQTGYLKANHRARVLRRLDEPRHLQQRQAGGVLPGRRRCGVTVAAPDVNTSEADFAGEGRGGALRAGRHPQRRAGGHAQRGRGARGGRAVPRTCSTSWSASTPSA
jgi:DNA polymerase-3 subunit alpha